MPIIELKTDIPILDDAAVAEIAEMFPNAEYQPTLAANEVDPCEFCKGTIDDHKANCVVPHVHALCQTVRALREQLNEETRYAAELRRRLVVADGVYNEKGEYTRYAQTAINRATDQLQSQLEQVTKERDEEKRLRAELKQVARAGFDDISSLGTTLQENAVIDFRSRAVALCRDKAAECHDNDMPASEITVLELMAQLEQLK